MSVLALVGLGKSYGSVVAVERVDAEIGAGQLLAIVGPSGCGKTTLLRMIGGFARPDRGRILIDGLDVTREPPNRRPTTLVFQSYALFPHLSVADNVGYALRVRGWPRRRATARVLELLELVGLEGLGERRPEALSGGQQQRVALARALGVEPRVLLLDEPLSNLDAHLRVRMRDEIKRLQRELHLTIVYVTHDQEEALAIADLVAVMRAGRLEQLGSPADVYERPASEFVAGFIGTANLLDGALEPGPGQLRIRTALGVLAVRNAAPTAEARGPARAVIRPEAVGLRAGDDSTGEPPLRGKIAAVTYTGALVRYAVDVEGLSLSIDVHASRSRRFSEGDRVAVELPTDVHVLAGPPGS